LDDILSYPTPQTEREPIALQVPVPVPDVSRVLAPFTNAQSNAATSKDEVHMHYIDYPWHEHDPSENIITPQEFQIRQLHHPKQSVEQQPAPAEQKITDEDLDDLDLFPNDDYADYETVFRTQTSATQNRTLHMSARDRESAEVYRPQNQTYEQGTTGPVNVPEHMRIIALPSEYKSEPTAPAASPTPSPTSQQVPMPEFYHPFRIHFQAPTQSHCMEDPISWPSKSPFACWWCKHTFECYPKVTPVSIRGTHVEVIGNFCSWNCCKTWTLHNLKRLDLFNSFYHTLFGENSNEVVPAPSYLSIDTFGGPLSIDEYRSGLNNPERQIRFETFSNVHIVVSKMFITY
jgi:hypothetical protein